MQKYGTSCIASTFGATIASTLLLSGTALATEGYFALGYSPNQRALAGAGVAHAFESMSTTVNPASAASVGRELQLGVEFFMPYRGYTGTGTGFVPAQAVDSGRNFFPVPNFSYNKPLDNGAVLNFSAYGNGGMNTSYGAGLVGCGTVFCAGPAGVDLSQLFVSITYAQKTGGLSFGISPTLAVQRFSAKGLAAFGGISVDPSSLTDNGHDYSYGGGLKFGVQYEASDTLRFGLAGQTKMYMSKFSKYSGLFENGGSFDIPASITAGVAWDQSPDLTLMLDYQHIFYSGVAAVSNSGSAGPLGAPGGAGFGWDDVDVIKLGAEWRQSPSMTWRFGYAYASNPVGPEDVTLNILAPGIVKHHLAAGGSYSINDRDRIDFAVNYVPESTVSGPEVTPGGVTPGSNVALNMHQFSLSVGWTRKF
ncbi:MAG: hydrocarbon degradation protein [Rhodobacteraceae bacterium]|nr:hydrocarbon degradation protein [Paracoccaceae bacterium]